MIHWIKHLFFNIFKDTLNFQPNEFTCNAICTKKKLISI